MTDENKDICPETPEMLELPEEQEVPEEQEIIPFPETPEAAPEEPKEVVSWYIPQEPQGREVVSYYVQRDPMPQNVWQQAAKKEKRRSRLWLWISLAVLAVTVGAAAAAAASTGPCPTATATTPAALWTFSAARPPAFPGFRETPASAWPAGTPRASP